MAIEDQDMEESVGSLRENQYVNLECRRDRQHTQVLWWSLITLNVLSGVIPSPGAMHLMIWRRESCSKK
nr:hypothetical protein CFP56_34619 [Quercus suber]